MNGQTSKRLAEARKQLKVGKHNRSITFSSHFKDGQRTYTAVAAVGTPETYRCSKHKAVELPYGTPCGGTH